MIRAGDLVIDLANCEVRVEGKIVELTFKEYELLKFLAKDRGRVFTREALLNKVWGYDYFGGDRTVDVHVRRLRSKIELSGQTFIETVRNIGYRFKKDITVDLRLFRSELASAGDMDQGGYLLSILNVLVIFFDYLRRG